MSLYSDTVCVVDGAVGYWRLGDGIGTTAADNGSGGNIGTVTGVVTFGQGGALSDANTAALFVASGSGGADTGGFITAAMAALGTTWTLELWMKRSVGAPASSREAMSFASTVEMYTPSGTTVIRLADAGGDRVLGLVNVCDGNWHYVVFACNGTDTRLYVDGVRDGNTYVGTPNIGATTINIGRYYGGGFTFDGWLDEVAIYTTALTAARVAAHYTLATKSQSVVGIAMPATQVTPLPKRNKSNQTYGWWSSPNKRKY